LWMLFSIERIDLMSLLSSTSLFLSINSFMQCFHTFSSCINQMREDSTIQYTSKEWVICLMIWSINTDTWYNTDTATKTPIIIWENINYCM
jgi:hypothetical protein